MEKEKLSKEKGLTVAKAQEMMSVNITAADIKTYFCPLANDKELYLALGVIKSLGLNPHTKEVHLVKYSANDKLSIIVGYEVYIKRAERTGKLAGWECGITEDNLKAWLRIYRKDWEKPFYWEVVLSEFDKKQATWKAIPTFMGKKVVIAQGFRLCFPDELGGMPYTQEEHQVYDVDAGIQGAKTDVPMPKEKINQPNDIKTVDQQALDEAADAAFSGPEAVASSDGLTAKALINGNDFMKMKSKFAGLCRHCNGDIDKGADVYFSAKQGLFHAGCVDVK